MVCLRRRDRPSLRDFLNRGIAPDPGVNTGAILDDLAEVRTVDQDTYCIAANLVTGDIHPSMGNVTYVSALAQPIMRVRAHPSRPCPSRPYTW